MRRIATAGFRASRSTDHSGADSVARARNLDDPACVAHDDPAGDLEQFVDVSRRDHHSSPRTGGALQASSITEDRLARVRALNEIANRRGQTLAEMALVWALRDPRMTSLVIGASSVKQLDDNVSALKNMSLTSEELAEIDKYAVDADINLWKKSSDE